MDKVVATLDLQPLIRQEQPGTPIVSSAIRWARSSGADYRRASIPDALAGAALSDRTATAGNRGLETLIAREERLRLGERGKSDLVLQMWFGEIRQSSKPARAHSDWLSRDEKEIDAFVADPLCGFHSRPARDRRAGRPPPRQPAEYLAAIRKDCRSPSSPASGTPVGPTSGLIQAPEDERLALHDPHLSGDRTNADETNRDEVTRDYIAWLDEIEPR